MNGELRQRDKGMRTLQRAATPILSCMRIYHNFGKPHMALNVKAPAEVAAVKVEGENKWPTVIQNASTK